MAIGWKVYCDGRLEYLASLRVAAISAATPDSRADASVDVQMTVTSQTTGMPACHGISVMPSGRYPSARLMAPIIVIIIIIIIIIQ